MSLRFFIDHHVPEAITDGLRRRNVDCLTAAEDARGREPDDVLLERATSLNRVMVTMDDDFLRLAAEWLHAGRRFSGIIYAHQLQITVEQAVRDLEVAAVALEPDEMVDQVMRLPL